jgi:hypothetical protein
MKQLNKLSNPNKIKLYTYLCQLEVELKGSFGIFNIKDPNLNNFLEQEKLLLGRMSDKNEQKIGNYKYFLLSNLRKPDKFQNIAGNDYAFLHLKHIRNAIAHGNVISTNKSNFDIKDYSEQGNLSAKGKLKSELLYRLIEELLKTRK